MTYEHLRDGCDCGICIKCGRCLHPSCCPQGPCEERHWMDTATVQRVLDRIR